MVAGGRPREQVIGQTERDEILDDEPIVAVCEFARGNALGVCGHKDRSAVFVRAGHHEDVVARHSHVTGEDIGGDSETCDVTDMAGAVGVGPGDGGKNTTHKG